VGGLLAYAGLLVVLAALVLLLWQAGLSPWVSALLVGVATLAIGGMLAMKGLKAIKQQDLTPQQTIDSIKQDVR